LQGHKQIETRKMPESLQEHKQIETRKHAIKFARASSGKLEKCQKACKGINR